MDEVLKEWLAHSDIGAYLCYTLASEQNRVIHEAMAVRWHLTRGLQVLPLVRGGEWLTVPEVGVRYSICDGCKEPIGLCCCDEIAAELAETNW